MFKCNVAVYVPKLKVGLPDWNDCDVFTTDIELAALPAVGTRIPFFSYTFVICVLTVDVLQVGDETHSVAIEAIPMYLREIPKLTQRGFTNHSEMASIWNLTSPALLQFVLPARVHDEMRF